jgi:hypothetical protein
MRRCSRINTLYRSIWPASLYTLALLLSFLSDALGDLAAKVAGDDC